MSGFFKGDDDKTKNLKKLDEQNLILPIEKNKKCEYCENLRIDTEILMTFNKKLCYDCKFTKLHLITKTRVLNDYLLNNDDISGVKFISKQNPRKGTWHDMQLYDQEEIKKLAINKYKSLENLEIEKERRKEMLMTRKKKKVKTRIKELRKKTIIEEKMKTKTHKHEFIIVNGISKCNCGMIIESEEL